MSLNNSFLEKAFVPSGHESDTRLDEILCSHDIPVTGCHNIQDHYNRVVCVAKTYHLSSLSLSHQKKDWWEGPYQNCIVLVGAPRLPFTNL